MPRPAIQHRGLVAFDAGAKLQVEPGAELPSRLVVAPWGSHDTQKGRIGIGPATVAQLPGNQLRANFDRVALDFNHNTVAGSEAYRGEPAKVAAHATPRIVAGEGIVFEDIEWTAEGREFVGGRHYIDLSPTIQLNADGEAVFIHSAAVCRQGAIPGLTLFSADSLPPQLVTLSTQPEQDLNESMDAKKLLAAILNVPDTTSDADLELAAKGFAHNVTALSSAAATLKSLNVETLKAETLRALTAAAPKELTADALTALNADAVKLLKALSTDGKVFKSFAELPDVLAQVVTDVAGLKGLHETAERNEIIRDATLQGRAIPASALEGEGKLNNLQLKALCASLPVTVPLDRRTIHLASETASGVLSNPEEIQVFAALGLSADEAKKFAK